MERAARSAAATDVTASPTEAGPRRTAGPGRGWGWAGRRQLHTFEKPARTVWERRGRDAVPRLRVLKLGTRPLADTWWGQAFQEPLRGVGTEGLHPAHLWWEPAYFWGQPPRIWHAGPAGLALILTSPQNGREWNSPRKTYRKFWKLAGVSAFMAQLC